jgi:hypothetical protein
MMQITGDYVPGSRIHLALIQVTLLVARKLTRNNPMEDKTDCGKNEAEKQSPPETPDIKARNNGAGEQDKQRIQDKDEEPKGYNRKGKCEDHENGSYYRVDEAEYQCSNGGSANAPHHDAGKQVCRDEDRECCYQPVDEQMHTRIYDRLSGKSKEKSAMQC